MRIKRFLLRYYPPEYKQGDNVRTRPIELPTDSGCLAKKVVKNEPLVRKKRTAQIEELIEKLKYKASIPDKKQFTEVKMIKAHDLPLTNLSFNKTGSHFITGSYDRTCKIWDAATGEEVRTLDGHTNVVYTVAFNLPVSAKVTTTNLNTNCQFSDAILGDFVQGQRTLVLDRIATGSFDKTVKLWDSESGECLRAFEGHSAEVVCLQFASDSRLLATGSMDTTAKVWDLETGVEMASLCGHTAEVIALHFVGRDNRLLLTGSFDHTAALWDHRTGRRVRRLSGHSAEVAAAACSFDGRFVATASMDKTLRVWDTRKGAELAILRGHVDEVLDVSFDLSGRQLASASADATAILWSTDQADDIHKSKKLKGHEGEVSKVCFSPRGHTVMTASVDKSVRLWDTLTGELRDVLVGHSDEVFSCTFNYDGDTIITGSKDNTCRIWQ
uniref:WD repeat containing protein 69 n=1 Tax=Echinococcus canadensis TaxID=519352 RepID=A0A915EW24_9CEST